jgi:hypothetical protein
MTVKIEHVHYKGWRIEWKELFDKDFSFYIAFDNAIASSVLPPDFGMHIANASDFYEGLDLCRSIIAHFNDGCRSAMNSYLIEVIKSERIRLERDKQALQDLNQESEEIPF